MNWGHRLLRLWPWLAAITTGVLCRLCFAPYEQTWLCWIALIPLLCAVWFSDRDVKRPWLRDLLLGYVAGATFFWFVFAWLTTVTVPGWVLVGAYMGVYFAGWALIAGRLRPVPREPSPAAGLLHVTRRLEAKRTAERGGVDITPPPNETTESNSPWLSSYANLRVAIVLAAAWVTMETIRGILFTGWGWNTLGHALHSQLLLIQIVDITGVPGLSFLVALTNVVLVLTARRFIDEARVQRRRPHFEFTLTLVAIVGVLSYGLRAVQNRPESTVVRVAALQPNIPREQKFDPDSAEQTFATFTRLSQAALQSKPDLLMWPESSMPGPVMQDEQSYRFVMDFASAAKIDLLLGAIDQDEKGAYNAALLLTEGGQHVQLYRKVHLVPFGEYVPGRHTLPGIARIVGDQVPDDFGFGTEHTVFKMSRDDVQLAPLICFEDTIGELTRQFVLGGANLLANVTNDGWFLETAGSKQHLHNAIFRCVETRLPMVRSANTGVTCLINIYGRVTQVLLDANGSQFTEGVLTGEVRVPVDYEPTFYVRHGELFAKYCAILTGGLVILLMVRALQSRRVQRAPSTHKRMSSRAREDGEGSHKG